MLEYKPNKPAAKIPERYTEALTRSERSLILRLRQLWNDGADIVIVEVRNDRPRVRRVGRLEG